MYIRSDAHKKRNEKWLKYVNLEELNKQWHKRCAKNGWLSLLNFNNLCILEIRTLIKWGAL